MATVKLVLRKRPNKDGTYPIVIRVIRDRKPSYIALGYAVKETEWDAAGERVKKSYPNSVRLNNLPLKKKAEAQNSLIEQDTKHQPVSIPAIREKVNPLGSAKTTASFFVQAKVFVDNLQQAGKYNRHKSEASRIKIFREFVGHDLAFKDITVTLLNQFRAYLLGSRKVKERTVINSMMLIRTIFNQAIKNGVIDKSHYPFGKDMIAIRLPDSVKVGLTAAEVKQLEGADLTGYQTHARNVWLLSFYFAGMRLSDVLRLRWSDLKDGRLHYAMSKNNKAGSLKIPAKAQAILDHYRNDEQKHNLVLPELKALESLDPYLVQKRIAFSGRRLEKTLKDIAKTLKDIAKTLNIDKKLSMHIARHSFAQIASDKIPVQILQKLYRHTHITTTIGYQSNFTTQHTDDALDKVIGD